MRDVLEVSLNGNRFVCIDTDEVAERITEFINNLT